MPLEDQLHYQFMLKESQNPADVDTKTTERQIASELGATLTMTYASLTDAGRNLLSDGGMPKQQVDNLVAALNLWRRVHEISPDALVGKHFGTDFDDMFLRFQDGIQDSHAERTRRDRAEQLLRWRTLHDQLRLLDTLPERFSDALKLAVDASPHSLPQIARSIGVAAPTLRRWKLGEGLPKSVDVHVIASLEIALELPKGALVRRLPPTRRTRYSRTPHEKRPSTKFGQRMQRNRRKGAYAIKFTPRIATQWKDLTRFKSDLTREGATQRNSWRVKPLEKTSFRVPPAAVCDGQVCATAGVHFGSIASYLGRLALPAPDGIGLALAEADTLAWLALPAHVEAHTRWMTRRADGIVHNGLMMFLGHVRSHIKPITGYVWSTPGLAKTLPDSVREELELSGDGPELKQAWQSHCSRAYERLLSFTNLLERRARIGRSRHPRERIETILQDDFPLLHLVAFAEALESTPPPIEHRRDYLSWLRDIVFVRMLISNPLRVGMYALMEYKPDNTGHLRRTGPGAWGIFFEPSDFKNEAGAACQPYSASVDARVVPWLERYLSEARPYLIDADVSDRLFLPTVLGPRKAKVHLALEFGVEQQGWTADGLSNRLKALTRIHIPGCIGFGAHAVRHIIATDHLKRNPADYVTVATLLHDTLATVMKEYAHLSASDGLRALTSGITQAMTELQARRGASVR
ncbi:hypothetical protein [Leptothrix discophora]|uniref:Tyr recombinase domain-containing protein n=1 Tax=Leptothrix discophora TaxID=89 RepID=A0ABT9G5B4_LEPDI|nr:hypothetical protein [Leptothrix discophora]MDP4301639.1 hypothetical protein [Leptothrix discophora]